MKETPCCKQCPSQPKNLHWWLTRRKMFRRNWILNYREEKILKKRSNSSVLLLPIDRDHWCLSTVSLSLKLRTWEARIQFQLPNLLAIEYLICCLLLKWKWKVCNFSSACFSTVSYILNKTTLLMLFVKYFGSAISESDIFPCCLKLVLQSWEI